MRLADPTLIAALPELGVDLHHGIALAEHTSLGIGGSTDLLRIRKQESIPALLRLLDASAIPHKFLGGVSKLLVDDGELPWIVLQLVRPDPDILIEGNFAHID